MTTLEKTWLQPKRSTKLSKSVTRLASSSGSQRRFLYAGIALLAVCYLLCPGVGIYDNVKELAYLQWQHDTLRHGQLNGYWWLTPTRVQSYPAVAVTHDFPAISETTYFSPLTPLLAILPAAAYLKVFVVVHLLIGAGGSMLLSRRLERMGMIRNRSFAETVLALSLVVNPFVFQHIAIGYTVWSTFWLLPFLLYFAAAERLSSAVLGAGATIALMMLEGGSHAAVLTFPIFVAWVSAIAVLKKSRRHALVLPGALVTAIPLALPRLVSTSRRFGDFVQSLQLGFDVNGLASSALAFPQTWGKHSAHFLSDATRVPSWDGSVFWAPLIAATAIAFGVFVAQQRHPEQLVDRPSDTQRRWRASCVLLTGALVCALLSLDGPYRVLVDVLGTLGDRIVAAEKYPFRFGFGAFTLLGLAGVLAAGMHRSVWQYHSKRQVGPSRQAWIASAVLAVIGFLAIIRSLIMTPSAVGEFGPTDPQRGWFFLGIAMVGTALVALRTNRQVIIETILVGTFLLATASWIGLATSVTTSTMTVPDPKVALASAGVDVIITANTATFDNRSTSSVVVPTGTPAGDLSFLRPTGGQFVNGSQPGASDFACPAATTCSITAHRAVLWPSFIAAGATWLGLALFAFSRREPRVAIP